MKECVQTTFADLFEHIPVLNTNEVYSLPQYPISQLKEQARLTEHNLL
jgi:hypothetical protein